MIDSWRFEYHTRRPHSALGYRPPAPLAIRPEEKRCECHINSFTSPGTKNRSAHPSRSSLIYVDSRTRPKASGHYHRDGRADDAVWACTRSSQCPKDIFPAVNMPEVNLVWYYPGMSAPEIEKRIVNITERATSQTVTGVDHIESNSFNGIGLIKIYFKENASTALAISQLSSVSSAIQKHFAPGHRTSDDPGFQRDQRADYRPRQHQRDADGNAALRLHVQLCRAVPVHVAGSCRARLRSAERPGR